MKPFVMPGDVGARAEMFKESGEHYWLFIYHPDFRRRVIDKAYAERRIWYVEKAPRTASEARALATELGVPRRFLEGLRYTKPPREAGEPRPVSPAFVASPEVGTWQHPRVEIRESGMVIRVGRRPR
jgi:hypothetical protein